jgi:hypothetical protein
MPTPADQSGQQQTDPKSPDPDQTSQQQSDPKSPDPDQSGYQQTEPEKPEPPETPVACDVGDLDDLQCDVAGIKRLAEVTAEYAPGLEQRRKKFDEAREGYAAARLAATPVVQEIRTHLTAIIDQVRCMLEEDDIKCLDDAYEDVRRRLEECRGPSAAGCCIDDDCDFDTTVVDIPTADLRARVADIVQRVEKAEQCFDSLVDEPTALAARVAALKGEVEALAAKLGGDPKTSQPARTYAEALIARRKLEGVWGGFADAGEFIDCLCQGLVCSMRGRQVLASLEAELAVRDCKDGKAKARCDWLEAHIVEEILETYERLCPPEETGPPQTAA